MAGGYRRYVDLGFCIGTGFTEKNRRLLSIAHLYRGDVLSDGWLALTVWRGAFEVLSD